MVMDVAGDRSLKLPFPSVTAPMNGKPIPLMVIIGAIATLGTPSPSRPRTRPDIAYVRSSAMSIPERSAVIVIGVDVPIANALPYQVTQWKPSFATTGAVSSMNAPTLYEPDGSVTWYAPAASVRASAASGGTGVGPFWNEFAGYTRMSAPATGFVPAVTCPDNVADVGGYVRVGTGAIVGFTYGVALGPLGAGTIVAHLTGSTHGAAGVDSEAVGRPAVAMGDGVRLGRAATSLACSRTLRSSSPTTRLIPRMRTTVIARATNIAAFCTNPFDVCNSGSVAR